MFGVDFRRMDFGAKLSDTDRGEKWTDMPDFMLRRDGITWSNLGDEIVLLDLRSSTYFSMRGTAAFLVTILSAGCSSETLVRRLLDNYDTTEATARADIAAFLAELEEHDLMETGHDRG